MDGFEDFTNNAQKMDYETLKELFKDKNLSYITELSDKEIRAVAIIKWLGKYAEIPDWDDFIDNILRLKVSKGRKGRKEFIEGFIGLKEKEAMRSQMQGQVIR
jgi:hypothetical protein